MKTAAALPQTVCFKVVVEAAITVFGPWHFVPFAPMVSSSSSSALVVPHCTHQTAELCKAP